ncbi:MAG: hypothetical protein KGL53_04380 [Elusimicrobia bacterium]|nr:hypothetical protein [Elusimicrobiota bacterium]
MRAVDAGLHGHPGEAIPIDVIGAGALMLQTGFKRGSKDSDILESADLRQADKDGLLSLAGPGTLLAKREGMYLQFVAPGIPFLPQRPEFETVASLSDLRRLRVRALGVVDVVVSKLKRFHANDRSDIREMVEADLVAPTRLAHRFRSAFEMTGLGAGREELARCVENLHFVEREFLGVAETAFELEG